MNIKRLYSLVFSRSLDEILGRGLELLFAYPLYAISFLCKRNPNRWALGTLQGFADNSKYLYLYLAQHPDMHILPIWISQSRSAAKALRTKGIKAYYKYSCKGLYYCLTASYYICTQNSKDINFFTSGGAKIVNLWHGVGIKRCESVHQVKSTMPKWIMRLIIPHSFQQYDAFLSTSPLMNQHFVSIFNLKEQTVVESIYPRCAFLKEPKELIHKHIEQYESSAMLQLINDMQQFRKVYIYMPTWRSNLKDQFLEVAGFDFEQLETTLAKINSLFLFKLHPAVRLHKTHNDFKHIRFMDKDMDVYPVLPFTDVLITDYSSIYYDYLLMDGKGALLFPFDREDYEKNSDPLAFDYDTYTPGKRVYTFADLLQVIESGDTCQVPEREWVMQQFWGKNYKEKTTQQLIERVQQLK